MQGWIEWAFSVFYYFSKNGKSVDAIEAIEAELVNLIIPEDDYAMTRLE